MPEASHSAPLRNPKEWRTKVMTLATGQIIKTLNSLIETCRDGEEGFRVAAEHVEDDHLKTLFENYCQQRAQLASELEHEVRRLGKHPENQGSTAGALHRGWINLKSAVTGRDDSAILAECEHGEDVAVEAYQEALSIALPAALKQIVSRQYSAIKAAHDRIRELEKTHTGSEAGRPRS